jgi:short-subunit dehydrogenase
VTGGFADTAFSSSDPDNFFGTLATTRGAILNVLSVRSWLHSPEYGAYSASKAAAWAMSNVVRQELAPQGTHVAALHVGYMDTDMAGYVAAENTVDPAHVATVALDELAFGAAEIIVGDRARAAKAQLADAPASLV